MSFFYSTVLNPFCNNCFNKPCAVSGSYFLLNALLISANSSFSLAVLGRGNFGSFFTNIFLYQQRICCFYVASHFCVLWQILSVVLKYLYLYPLYCHCSVTVLAYLQSVKLILEIYLYFEFIDEIFLNS